MDETSKLSTKPLVRGSKEHMDLMAAALQRLNKRLGAIVVTEAEEDQESETPQLQATFISKPRSTPKLPD